MLSHNGMLMCMLSLNLFNDVSYKCLKLYTASPFSFLSTVLYPFDFKFFFTSTFLVVGLHLLTNLQGFCTACL